MAWTHIFVLKRESVLHCFLRILVVWLLFAFLGESQKEIDEDERLDKDVPLESEVAQLHAISYCPSQFGLMLRTSSLNRSRLVRYFGLNVLANSS